MALLDLGLDWDWAWDWGSMYGLGSSGLGGGEDLAFTVLFFLGIGGPVGIGFILEIGSILGIGFILLSI